MSITLNANAINQLIIGGVTVETDGASAVTSLSIDYQGGFVTFVMQKGTVNGASFTTGQVAAGTLTVVINLVTGLWQVVNGTQSGTLVGAALTNLQNTVKGWRNNAESFANTTGIQPGTIVAW